MPALDINDLFAETLVGDYDDDAPWKAVHALRQIGSREVFEFASEWCTSLDPLKRTRGVDVLAQLGKTADHPSNSFPEEAYSIVVGLLGSEEDVRALDSEITALGHLENPLAIPLITRYRTHQSEDVRFSVAFALGSFPDDPRSVDSLLLLMEDVDEDVRDWATFGLGTLSSCDSPEIREVLFRRLDDTNTDVRQEAMAGLGKRADERVVPFLLETLDRPPVSDCVLEASYQMLGMDADREDWDTDDYATALRSRFGR
jgi:HEAT repeat protein